jgi:hypothetical protein
MKTNAIIETFRLNFRVILLMYGFLQADICGPYAIFDNAELW